MSAVLNTNVASLWASKNLLGAQSKLAGSVERLSSGLRINRARDDAAGLGVANSLTAQINGANQGVRNLNDAISMVQTAEGAIAAASEMGQRILMLATQAANSTLGAGERDSIKQEMQQLISSINSIGSRTAFSGNELLSTADGQKNSDIFKMQISNNADDVVALKGSAFQAIGGGSSSSYPTVTKEELGGLAAGTYKIYVDVSETATPSHKSFDLSVTVSSSTGARTYKVQDDAASNGTIATAAASTNAATSSLDGLVGASKALGASATAGAYTLDLAATSFVGLSLGSGTGKAQELHTAIEAATTSDSNSFRAVQTQAQKYVDSLTAQRGVLGAYQNQMEYTLSNITELSSNLQSARSRVIDTDYASETASLTKGQILQQAATAMLAQANQMPNVILTLLK